MASIINATTSAGVQVTGDNSGALALQTNNGTTAVTIDTSQNLAMTGGGQIRSNATSTPPTFADSAGTQIGTLCRAWVSFTGSGSAVKLGSFNVSSVTFNGTGDYTVTFTNAMPDANYAAATGAQQWRLIGPNDTTTTYIATTFIRVTSLQPSNGTALNSAWNTVAIFR